MPSNDDIIEIKRKLEEHEKRIMKLEEELKQKKEKPTEEVGVDIKEGIEKLYKDAGINEEQLRYVYDFEKEDVRLIATIDGKDEKEKQFKATLCILTVYHYCYGQDEIKSKDLRIKLKWTGIKSLSNLSKNLAKYKQFIISKGKPKSQDFRYKITTPGIRQASQIIKELSGA